MVMIQSIKILTIVWPNFPSYFPHFLESCLLDSVQAQTRLMMCLLTTLAYPHSFIS